MGYLMFAGSGVSEADASSLSGKNDITMYCTACKSSRLEIHKGNAFAAVGIWRNDCWRASRLAVATLERLDFADLQFRNRP
jgi:hypothetical protein